jgi:SAM-dependent methyltransferase
VTATAIHPSGSVRRPAPTRLRSTCGLTIPLDVDRWFREPAREEEPALERALAPTLDVGCGPARHTLELLRRGVAAVGVDVSPGAVRIARARGAPVIRATVFAPLPLEGRWGTVLLLDGNVGIGGDPLGLLRRARELVRRHGRVIVEVEPPGTASARLIVRAEHDAGGTGRWFPWARVGADAVRELAAGAGFGLEETWSGAGRWFVRLDAR